MSNVKRIAVRVLLQISRDLRATFMLLILPVVELYLLKVAFDAFGGADYTGPYLLPFAAFLVQFITYILCLLALVRERTQGTLARTFVAGYRRLEVVAGYTVAYSVLATVISLETLLGSIGFFSLSLNASQALGTFVTLWLLGVASLALGVLFSSRAKSEGEVVSYIPAFILPSILLSGMLIPLVQLPAWANAIGYLVPLRYAVPVLNALVMARYSLASQALPLLPLLLWVAAFLLLAGLSLPGDAAQETGSSTPRATLAAGLVVVAALGGGWLWYQSTHYIQTDNAFVAGKPVLLGPTTLSTLSSLQVTTGERVQSGQEVALLSQTSNSTDLNLPVPIFSPVAGLVIDHLAAGTLVAPGQAVVTLIDPSQLWFQANVPEDQVSRVKPGQKTTIHLDECGQNFPGLTVGLIPATASFIGGLNLNNATVTFSKVAQTVPVKIMPTALPAACRLFPGLSAEVSIKTTP